MKRESRRGQTCVVRDDGINPHKREGFEEGAMAHLREERVEDLSIVEGATLGSPARGGKGRVIRPRMYSSTFIRALDLLPLSPFSIPQENVLYAGSLLTRSVRVALPSPSQLSFSLP